MIISASRRTDIPAFYGQWFNEGIKRGFVQVKNPFNAKQIKTVSLKREDVDAFVFWTRNHQPFQKYLELLDSKNYPYYFLYTITGYPKPMEHSTPDKKIACQAFKDLSRRIGAERVIWRYDPIVFSSLTDKNFHEKNFESIAGQLKSYCKTVIISFVDNYKKVQRQFKQTPELVINDNEELKKECSQKLATIASRYHLKIQSCAEEKDWSPHGVPPGKCIDDSLLRSCFGLQLNSKKDPGQREQCSCIKSVDIGSYNTCPHGCIYCYATSNEEKAKFVFKSHDHKKLVL